MNLPIFLRISALLGLTLTLMSLEAPRTSAQVAVDGKVIYTMAGPPIRNGRVLIRDGKIAAVGPASEIEVPDGFRHLQAAIVTPGLIDAHATVGLTGILNIDHDQDQLERSQPVQPELRAVDAYNPHEPLVAWVRSFGITTVHTGHGPGELISGQTMIVKTAGKTVEQATVRPAVAVAATLAESALKSGKRSPGTRGKMMAMLRSELIRAREYLQKQKRARQDPKVDPPERDLRLETLGRVLQRELALMVTAHRAQDIASALRLADEFSIRLWLDGAAEAYLLIDEIRKAGVPVLIHPPMARAVGELENASFETATQLARKGIPVALQSGYEGYVPKTRVVLFEAALAAAHGLGREKALATITIDAAKILGIDNRVGSLEVGKDGDLALYDGDPFEYTTHCVGVVIEGHIVSRKKR